MSVTKSIFDKLPTGEQIDLFIIENENGMKAEIITLGATLQSLYVKDKKGYTDDILVGFNTLDGYLKYWNNQGATIGPVANRIANGKFNIDGTEYNVTINENGITTVHSALEFNYAVWNADILDDKSISFTYLSPDGVNGFPGNINVKVTYTLDNENALHINYEAISDKKTPISLTNHAYFNLKGCNGGTICDHFIKFNSSYYTPVDKFSIPTGKIESVENTAFDLREYKQISEHINDDTQQINFTGGYDHNFCIDGYDGTLKNAVEVYEETTGRLMTVYTDLPGVQFYAGNFLKGEIGKNNKPMEYRTGFCLETQYYPDSVNKPEFPSCIFEAGQKFISETVYKFSVK